MTATSQRNETTARSVVIPINAALHAGELTLPHAARGLVLFAHGSGSSRLSPRNVYVARALNQSGVATLLFDLLTEDEDAQYRNRFNILLLTERLMAATDWAERQPALGHFGVGYFGASTGAAAALKAAAARAEIRAIVSRGGRPDLALRSLPQVRAPTLLIVGGHDDAVIEMNRSAYAELDVPKALEIVPGATHLFEEPGALEQVAQLAANWFATYLPLR